VVVGGATGKFTVPVAAIAVVDVDVDDVAGGIVVVGTPEGGAGSYPGWPCT
jgi:hypothetical protein